MTNILAGLDGDDLARAQASIANARAIAEGRRRAARALLAPGWAKRETWARWSAILDLDRAVAPSSWGPAPGWVDWLTGDGPPTADLLERLEYGDHYVDRLTGAVYRVDRDGPSYWARDHWIGDGPPPADLTALPGLSLGDTWVDRQTGTVYELTGVAP